MPRKTKEIVVQNDIKINDEEVKKLAKKSSKTVAEKKTTKTAKSSSEDKSIKEKSPKKAESVKKTTKKTETKKKAVKKEEKKTATKKTSTSKTTKKATTTAKKATKVAKSFLTEYYDLPYRYNQTVVKILAQTPNSLFIYWDISDLDRESYSKKYGENFFNETKPVIKIYNDTLNYNFEIDVDDFANGWYVKVNDANCVYRAELARRPKYYNSNIQDNYIYITSSNKIDSPNDHILFEKITPNYNFKFKNVKNNNIYYKNISNILNGKNILFQNNNTDIKNLYSLIYEKQNIEELYGYSNPSSNFSSRN